MEELFSSTEALFYLAAMIDGEGCVEVYLERGQRTISISNTEESIAKRIVRCLDLLEVDCSVYLRRAPQPDRKDFYEIRIGGEENLRYILHSVPLASKAKRQKLELAVSSYPNKRPASRKKLTARPAGW